MNHIFVYLNLEKAILLRILTDVNKNCNICKMYKNITNKFRITGIALYKDLQKCFNFQ